MRQTNGVIHEANRQSRPSNWYRVDDQFKSPHRSAEREQAEGKAFFVQDPSIGYLKVSFFGPFYGSYVVFGLDKVDYKYAFISGPDTSYLWLLSRTPQVSDQVMNDFLQQAGARGFDLDQLLLVNQEY